MVNFLQIIGLAAVDAINPCALAVMVIVLVSLLMQDPEKKSKVIWGGLAFTLAVFILYFIYGIVLTQFFAAIIPANVARYVFKGFAVLAMLLGIMNIKDFIVYKPGGFGTEMPMTFRPRMKLMIKRITSPKGAFVIGIFVTLFLLPCTIGPYIIASGVLSDLTILQVIPWLLIYNLVFIIPMIAITLIIYFGFSTTEKVSGWKDMNIRYIHLIEGIILLVLGILMFMGII